MKRKKTPQILALGILITGLMSCYTISSKEKQKETTGNLRIARKEIHTSQMDSILAQHEFIAQAEKRLRENNRQIDDLKKKIKTENSALRIKYTNILTEMKNKNTLLRVRVYEYKPGVEEDWDTFVYNFDRDMDNLKESLSEIIKKNTTTK